MKAKLKKVFNDLITIVICTTGFISVLIIICLMVAIIITSKPSEADLVDPIAGPLICFAHSHPWAAFFVGFLLIVVAALCAVGGDALLEWWVNKRGE